ncbi:MAG: DUF711 family protein, partial [Candidatus Micrarchaeota archaeon]
MLLDKEEILETFKMVHMEHLDVRAVTLGISLLDCADPNAENAREKIFKKITTRAQKLVSEARKLEEKYGIPIINKRISVTPISILLEPVKDKEAAAVDFARALDESAKDVGVDFIGGFSALVEKGFTPGDIALINSLPEALAKTERVCSSVNAASTRAGINMDAVALLGKKIKEISSKSSNGIGCAKFVVFANAPEDNPFMAGAFHGLGEHECTLNVGISGPGVVRSVVENSNGNFRELADSVKRTSFKVTRVGELIGKELASSLNVKFGIVDLSLAPTTAEGDSVAAILEAMGLEKCGA